VAIIININKGMRYMNYIEQIKNYIPYNDQETKDKDLMLDYINRFDNILLRDNKMAHMTSSSWVVNKDRSKILLVHHNIYNSWAWTGGHADGCDNLLEVAIREAKEETGINNIKPIINEIFSLEILCVNGHIKNSEYVPSHLHLNLTYLLEADETEELIIKEDENSGVKWFSLETGLKSINEKWMIENIYKKLNNKLQKGAYNE
jgi:8-oxo-dGTP pyrophosphatase MutT (NUDIX family)